MMSTGTRSTSLTPARSSSSFRSRTARLFPQRFTLAIMDIHSVDTQERIRITDWVNDTTEDSGGIGARPGRELEQRTSLGARVPSRGAGPEVKTHGDEEGIGGRVRGGRPRRGVLREHRRERAAVAGEPPRVCGRSALGEHRARGLQGRAGPELRQDLRLPWDEPGPRRGRRAGESGLQRRPLGGPRGHVHRDLADAVHERRGPLGRSEPRPPVRERRREVLRMPAPPAVRRALARPLSLSVTPYLSRRSLATVRDAGLATAPLVPHRRDPRRREPRADHRAPAGAPPQPTPGQRGARPGLPDRATPPEPAREERPRHPAGRGRLRCALLLVRPTGGELRGLRGGPPAGDAGDGGVRRDYGKDPSEIRRIGG